MKEWNRLIFIVLICLLYWNYGREDIQNDKHILTLFTTCFLNDILVFFIWFCSELRKKSIPLLVYLRMGKPWNEWIIQDFNSDKKWKYFILYTDGAIIFYFMLRKYGIISLFRSYQENVIFQKKTRVKIEQSMILITLISTALAAFFRASSISLFFPSLQKFDHNLKRKSCDQLSSYEIMRRLGNINYKDRTK